MRDTMIEEYNEFCRMMIRPMEITLKDAFEAGYRAASPQEAWEDGYKHGYDEGRYKSIEEG
jgi:hypothetical protein